MFYYPIFADSADAAGDIVQSSTQVGREIQIAMKQTWLDVLQGPLFVSVCNLGAVLAAICLVFFVFVWLKSVANPSDPAVMSVSGEKIFIIIMILILIGTPVNRGKLLGTVVIAAHDVMVGLTDGLVGKLSDKISGDITAQGNRKLELETQIPQQIEECLTIDDIPKRDFCLLRADDKLKGDLSEFSNQGWALKTYEIYHEVINDSLSKNSKDPSDPLGNIVKFVNSDLGELGQGLAFQVIRSVIVSFGSAYLILLEHGMLLTGLICPLFLGVSLSSQEFDAIKAWALCYFGLGAALTMYKIILGLVSLTILNSPPNDPLVMPLVLTLGSIFLSLILIGGGGVAIFGGVTRTARLLN